MTSVNAPKEEQTCQFHLNQFEGPLHLLLFLIRKNKINIHDIPIAEITEQYLNYIQYAISINLEDITEFHLMTTTLLHIKSQMLLPIEVNLEDEPEDPRKELVQRLIEYERIRKLTDLMAKREEQNQWLIERKNAQAFLPFPDEEEFWDEVDIWDLLRSFNKIMRKLGREHIINIWEEFSIKEKITLIREYLENREEFVFEDLLMNPKSTMEVVSAFWALLEMVKEGSAEAFQKHVFGTIRVKPTLGNRKNYP